VFITGLMEPSCAKLPERRGAAAVGSKKDQEADRASPHDRPLTIFDIATTVALSWEGYALPGLHGARIC